MVLHSAVLGFKSDGTVSLQRTVLTNLGWIVHHVVEFGCQSLFWEFSTKNCLPRLDEALQLLDVTLTHTVSHDNLNQPDKSGQDAPFSFQRII